MRVPRSVRCIGLLYLGVTLTLTARALSGSAAAVPGARLRLEDGPIEISDLIHRVAEVTGRSFLFDDTVRRPVTLARPIEVPADQAYQILEAFLEAVGLTAVEGVGGAIRVMPSRDAATAPIPTLPPEKALAFRERVVTRWIPLRHVPADDASQLLQPFLSDFAKNVTYLPMNSLLVTDLETNLIKLERLLSKIDLPGNVFETSVLPLQNSDADTVRGQLEEIFSAGSNTEPVARRALATRDDVVATLGSRAEPRFFADERTRSLIVRAPRSLLLRIRALVTLLDGPVRRGGSLRVYRVQNADAEELAQVLQSAATGRAVADAGDLALARIVADAPTNSLIVQATAEGHRELGELLAELDRSRPQVLLDVTVMEIDVDELESLGSGLLYITDHGAIGTNTGNVTGLGGGLGPETDPGVFRTTILGDTTPVVQPDSSIVQVPSPQAILEAAASTRTLNLLSSPMILIADNEPAEIFVGDNIPVATSSTSEVGAFATAQTIERQDVGVTLRVTPQISEGEHVKLEVYLDVRELVSQDPVLGPTTAGRTIQLESFLESGESLMISSFLDETRLETVQKVPFLGDIPVIGWAFKSRSETVRRTMLLVLLSPHVLRDPGELLKRTNSRRGERGFDQQGAPLQ